MINVLVFPCGSEIGLEVNEALKRDKHIELYGLSSVPCHGRFVFKNYLEGIPFYTEDSFLDELNAIITKHNIDIIIPAYDDVIMFLSEHREELQCRLATSSKEACRIARSKVLTYEAFRDCDFTPKTYSAELITPFDLPLFAKPDIGQGSQGVRVLRSADDIEAVKGSASDYVICELLDGPEYTVDCFTDSEGNIINMSMRTRNRTRNGISVNTSSVTVTDEIRRIGETINERMRFNGVWFFQVKEDSSGRFKLLEFAPRVAGSMSLSRVRGFNYILNMVYQSLGYKVTCIPQLIDEIEEDRSLSNVYRIPLDYDTVYLDLDDTLIYGDKVNTEAIAFIYQCVNQGKRVKLLSRHFESEFEALRKYHIDAGLFSEVIHVEDDLKKSSFIKDEKAIFIDDSFRERKDVSESCGIPVFDIDCIPALTCL